MEMIPIIAVIALAYVVATLLTWITKKDMKDALLAGSATWIIVILAYTHIVPYETVLPFVVFLHTVLFAIIIQIIVWGIKADMNRA